MTAPPWGAGAPPQPPVKPATDGDDAEPDGDDPEHGAGTQPAYLDIDEPLPDLASSSGAEATTPAGNQAPVMFPVPPAYPAMVESEERGRSRTAVVATVAAVGVAVAAVAGVGVLVFGRDAAAPAGPATPSAGATAAAGPPPGDLRLRDDSSTITLSWTDPTGGGVSFMVAGGRAGQTLGVMATVDPGRTSYTVNGLNSRVDYCFTVLAVYSTDSFATSGQVCTDREANSAPS